MHKTHWNETLSSALSFPFFKRKSGRIVSFLNNFKNGGSLAKFRRFGAVNFHFLKTSRRIASVLMLPTSKRKSCRSLSLWSCELSFFEEVSQNCFGFDVVNFKNGGGLAKICRFGAVNFHFLKTSRGIASVLMLSTSKMEEVSPKFVALEL